MVWKKIKAEYIAGGISYREIAKKYGVSFNTLKTIAIREKWTELRQQAENRATTKAIENVATGSTKHTANIYDVADKLLDKITSLLEEENITTQNVRSLTAALKDIKDIKGIKSELDLKEQEARIDKLRKEIKEEKKDTNINITFGEEVKKYGV